MVKLSQVPALRIVPLLRVAHGGCRGYDAIVMPKVVTLDDLPNPGVVESLVPQLRQVGCVVSVL